MSPHRPFSLGRVALSNALRASVAVLACTGAAAASAQGFSVGVAAGPDRGRVDCVASFPCDRASTQFKLGGAWNFADAWDVQLAYFRAGSYRGGDPIPSACSTRSPPHRLTDRAMRNHEQSPRLKSAACSA